MFSGIIHKTSTVDFAEARAGNYSVRIKTPRGWKLALGQSISVDGICSTVVKRTPAFFEVQYVRETLLKTTAGSFVKGVRVNIERSLTLRDYIDGHLVAGHVDARGSVIRVHQGILSISVPKPLSRFIAEKGSVAVNGVALTVVSRKANVFSVAIIPYTEEHTNLGALEQGDVVNIEVDMVARYLDALGKKR
jgi:riboflavin synthase